MLIQRPATSVVLIFFLVLLLDLYSVETALRKIQIIQLNRKFDTYTKQPIAIIIRRQANNRLHQYRKTSFQTVYFHKAGTVNSLSLSMIDLRCLTPSLPEHTLTTSSKINEKKFFKTLKFPIFLLYEAISLNTYIITTLFLPLTFDQS